MRKKGWLIAAASLVVAGLVVFAVVMTVLHWDFSRLSTDPYETNTYEITEKFSKIDLHTETADVLLAASDDGRCTVICDEQENVRHSVDVQNGTLTVHAVDDRQWYEHIGIHLHSPKVTVYLPKADYASLAVKGSTGEIGIQNLSVGTVNISVSTGEVIVSDVTCQGAMEAEITTGQMNVTNTACQSLLSRGSTGDISLKNVTVTGTLSIERSTGDILFDRADAAEIFMKTDTGNVAGSFCSEKVFITETSTGRVDVPKTVTGGRCEIKTSTGNIAVEIADGNDSIEEPNI